MMDMVAGIPVWGSFATLQGKLPRIPQAFASSTMKAYLSMLQTLSKPTVTLLGMFLSSGRIRCEYILLNTGSSLLQECSRNNIILQASLFYEHTNTFILTNVRHQFWLQGPFIYYVRVPRGEGLEKFYMLLLWGGVKPILT